jgi:hypothetical protein
MENGQMMACLLAEIRTNQEEMREDIRTKSRWTPSKGNEKK